MEHPEWMDLACMGIAKSEGWIQGTLCEGEAGISLPWRKVIFARREVEYTAMQFRITRIPCTVSRIRRLKRVAAAMCIMTPLRTVVPVVELVLRAVDRHDNRNFQLPGSSDVFCCPPDDAPGTYRSANKRGSRLLKWCMEESEPFLSSCCYLNILFFAFNVPWMSTVSSRWLTQRRVAVVMASFVLRRFDLSWWRVGLGWSKGMKEGAVDEYVELF